MKYSFLGIKTNKTAKDFDSINATLLIKAGFIDQTMAGAYTFLPMGLRVLNKIENIVREEMDKIGVEMIMPALSPKSLWKQTNRLETVDVLFKASGANQASMGMNDSEYILNSTHEEVITPIVKRHAVSYKDLPVAFYQIQSKFRNEARPKSGILRGREFRMKDLYSFHATQEDLMDYYEKSKIAYTNVFNRLGLGDETLIVLASGGDFTKDFSHEFQTRCETGEDTIFYDKELDVAYNREVAPSLSPLIKQAEDLKEMTQVFGENITGMKALVEFLDLPYESCVKTLIYQADDKVIAVAVRGDYEINEVKLKSIVGAKDLRLADEQVVRKVTGAIVGYAGLMGLSSEVSIYIDDALKDLVNFECGSNKDNYHSINVNWNRDLPKPKNFYDLKLAKEGDLNPETKESYEVFKASEVGNIFPLNTKFSTAFKYSYADKDGKQKPVYMGSYGIGTSRLMGVIVEKYHDENGIIWPSQVSPYLVHLITLADTQKTGSELYNQLIESGIEVFWDDREVSPGEKFSDSDLMGIPIRLVISKRNKGKFEVKRRDSKEITLLDPEEIIDYLTKNND